MERKVQQYEFINSQTGNVIGYLTVPNEIDESGRRYHLQKRQGELAEENGLFVELIYFQLHKDS